MSAVGFCNIAKHFNKIDFFCLTVKASEALGLEFGSVILEAGGEEDKEVDKEEDEEEDEGEDDEDEDEEEGGTDAADNEEDDEGAAEVEDAAVVEVVEGAEGVGEISISPNFSWWPNDTSVELPLLLPLFSKKEETA